MESLQINEYLVNENLFELFCAQLKKDFEGSGLSAEFTGDLPREFNDLKNSVLGEVKRVISKSALPALLYRVDISEKQLTDYQKKNSALSFEEVISELIIKRVLQKVILKKRFST